MARTITLRVSDRVYDALRAYAEADNRTLSNLIETSTLRHLEECALVTSGEMEEIRSDPRLVSRIRAGSRAARRRQGRFVP